MRRGMEICSHSHPHSKGYYHMGDRCCCSLEGLAQAHMCLSSRSLFSLSQSGLGTLHPIPWVPSYLINSTSSLECFSVHHQKTFLSLTLFHVWIIFASSFLIFILFWICISSRPTNSFTSLDLSSFCASLLTHSFRLLLLLFYSSRNPIYSHIQPKTDTTWVLPKRRAVCLRVQKKLRETVPSKSFWNVEQYCGRRCQLYLVSGFV